jgi:hypothetical protein
MSNLLIKEQEIMENRNSEYKYTLNYCYDVFKLELRLLFITTFYTEFRISSKSITTFNTEF